MKKVVFLSSQAFSLYNFRGGMIVDLVNRGFAVYAIAPDHNEISRDKIIAMGAIPFDIKLDRVGFNIFKSISSLLDIIKALKEIDPDILIVYFVKPIILGLIASIFTKIKIRIAIIEGLGYAFSKDETKFSFKRFLIRLSAIVGYRFSLKSASVVFFLNSYDLYEMVALNIVTKDKSYCLGGIGVDLSQIKYCQVCVSPVTFIMVARLLREKGVVEYVEAARLIKSKFSNVRFLLLGDIDSNPSSLDEFSVNDWVSEGVIEWPGHVDVYSWLGEASVFVLPSYYREGVPRSIQEAMAVGLPIITTDIPGCRETVACGVNGYLVPPRNVIKLVDAMTCFINEPEKILEMGLNSRKICEEKFNQDLVNDRFLVRSGIIQK